VFTEDNPHYQQEQKSLWEGRENRTVKTERAQVLLEAAPGVKLPSCSLKKELHHLRSYFTDRKPGNLFTLGLCEATPWLLPTSSYLNSALATITSKNISHDVKSQVHILI